MGGGGRAGASSGCASGVAVVLLEAAPEADPQAALRVRGRMREQWDAAEAADTDATPPPPKVRGAKRGQLGAVPQAADCTERPSKRRNSNDVRQGRRRHGRRGEAPGDLGVLSKCLVLQLLDLALAARPSSSSGSKRASGLGDQE